MAQTSRFWTTDGNGDGATAYTMAEIAEVFRTAFTSDNYATQGVLKGYLNGLAVSGTASPISVATGAAMVYGFFYTNDAALDVAVATPISGTTGHRLVLRASWSTTQTVRVYDIASADGTATIPAVTQTPGTTYDITLATFTITTGGVIAVTDARAYCHYPTMTAAGFLDADSVDDTIAGNRVPRLDRRQGGSASVWETEGSTDYTPTTVRMQCGVIADTSTGANNGDVVVTFPVAFSQKPIVLATYAGNAETYPLVVGTLDVDATQCTIHWCSAFGAGPTNPAFSWLAVGPE
jgi:hypothetical protein